MSHRALVAYRRPPDRFAVHYAHHGPGLAEAITPDTPFGGPVERRAGGRGAPAPRGVRVVGGYDPPPTAVDPVPLRRRATAEELLGAVDASVEWLVVVDADWTTRRYLVCPLDFPAGAATDPDIALVRPDGDPAALGRWTVAARSSLDAAVAAGPCLPAVARLLYRRGLAHRGRVHRLADASFLLGD